MVLKTVTRSVFSLVLFSASIFGQTVTSSMQGTVVDPADAAIASAPVTLTSQDTGAVRSDKTDSAGLFHFTNIAPGSYSITIKATGFKTLTTKDIAVDANSTRDIGNVKLSIGNVADQVSVTAEATPIQLGSAEKASTIDGGQLVDLTMKGRDLFGFLKLVPGVIDDPTNQQRNATDPNAIRGITINGNTSAFNFTVDGITDMDTGSNSTLHYEPNLDAIQELKVLTSNYQAEFGRNSGGTITVVTKNGTQQFHGTGNWNHRHEEFDSNSWSNNRGGTMRPAYRYNIETYSIGGPVFIPKVFNTQKKKLFFFWSQEKTGQFLNGGTQNKYTPTALERTGDFSKSLNNNGSLNLITDPTLGLPCSSSNSAGCFPGNVIPQSRIDPSGIGPAMLAFFPLPNYAGVGTQANIVNYQETAGAQHPRRNDVLRIDTYLTSKMNGFFRWINDADDMIALYQGIQFTKDIGGTLGSAGISPIDHPNPGHGYAGDFTYTFSPSLINEATVGNSWNTWSYYTLDNYATEDRSLVKSAAFPNGPPLLFPLPKDDPANHLVGANGYPNLLPQFSFGSVGGGSAMSYGRNNTSAGAYENFNPIWTYQDNLSKVAGKHTMKTGFYLEHNVKLQPAGTNYSGNYNFSPDSNNLINNANNGYANAFLGYVDTFSQQTARTVVNVIYWNFEAFLQDNWRATKRLTLDYGVRFYHQTPQVDTDLTFSNFVPSKYTKASAPRVYIPGCKNGATNVVCSGSNSRVAVDPGSGAVAPVAYIGLFVPNSGNPADGYVQQGVGGNPLNAYSQSPVAVAPRIGFAYDLFGDGKTSIKGGFGIFFNRLDGNTVYGLGGQPPLAYQPTTYYTTPTQIGASTSSTQILGPSGPTYFPEGNIPWDGVRNGSIDVQHSIGRSITVDIGYTGNWGYHQNIGKQVNAIPLGTRWPFNAANVDPTRGNASLPDIILRSVYPAFNGISQRTAIGHTNYNALTASANRRLQKGLAFGVAYTFSKALGTTSFNPLVADNEAYNYGRLGSDRRQNLQINYAYDLPKPGKILNSRLIGYITDNFQISGITSYTSGPPFNPGVSLLNASTPDATGTPDIGARLNVVGDPHANVPAGLWFNPLAFQLATGLTNGTGSVTRPVLGNLGGGSGVLSQPGYTNFDMSVTKIIPLGSERRRLRIQVQAYNIFNHTEYNTVGTGVQYDPVTGNQTSLTVGTFTGALSNNGQNRIIAFSARFEF